MGIRELLAAGYNRAIAVFSGLLNRGATNSITPTRSASIQKTNSDDVINYNGIDDSDDENSDADSTLSTPLLSQGAVYRLPKERGQGLLILNEKKSRRNSLDSQISASFKQTQTDSTKRSASIPREQDFLSEDISEKLLEKEESSREELLQISKEFYEKINAEIISTKINEAINTILREIAKITPAKTERSTIPAEKALKQIERQFAMLNALNIT